MNGIKRMEIEQYVVQRNIDANAHLTSKTNYIYFIEHRRKNAHTRNANRRDAKKMKINK